jgi:membrane-associated phospholipid phosphatase
MKATRLRPSGAVLGALLLGPRPASADPPSTVAPPPTTQNTVPPGPPGLELGQHFVVDPVLDGVVVAGGAGFSVLLGLVLSSGEISANLPGPTSNLLSWDRVAVTQSIDPNAGTYSNIGLYTAIGFAVLDPVVSGVRDGWDAALVDAMIYAETASMTETFTDVTKIAVRRPRPIDYVNCPYPQPTPPKAGCTATNLNLSFFSGHAATVASIGATATYLAFVRDPDGARPWITLGASVALTGFVSYERVRSGQHFPTDVIAGSMAGAAMGIVVPHLHRHKQEAPTVWVGAAPAPGGGGSLTVGGSF